MTKSSLCMCVVLGVVGYCGSGSADDWEDELEDRIEAYEEAREERRERIEEYYEDREDYYEDLYEDLAERRGRHHHGYLRPRRSFGFSLHLGRGIAPGFYGRRPFYGPRYGRPPFGYDNRYYRPPSRHRYFGPGYCW